MRAEVQPHGEGRRRGASLLDVHSLVRLDREEIPDRARGNELAGLEDDRIEEPVVVDAEDTARGDGCGLHALRGGRGRRHRLLDQHVHAPLQRRNRRLGVARGWREDVDRVEREAEQISRVPAHLLGRRLRAEGARPLEIHVADPDDADARRRLEVAAMDAGDAAAADQADTNFGRGSAHAWVEK